MFAERQPPSERAVDLALALNSIRVNPIIEKLQSNLRTSGGGFSLVDQIIRGNFYRYASFDGESPKQLVLTEEGFRVVSRATEPGGRPVIAEITAEAVSDFVLDPQEIYQISRSYAELPSGTKS